MADMVNHPPHYQGAGGLEVIDVIERYDLGYHLGNAFKYLARAGKKGDTIEDLKKARWYLNRWRSKLEAGLSSLPEPHVGFDVWASPDLISVAFGLGGTRADAVLNLLSAVWNCTGRTANAYGFAALIEAAVRCVNDEIERLEALS